MKMFRPRNGFCAEGSMKHLRQRNRPSVAIAILFLILMSKASSQQQKHAIFLSPQDPLIASLDGLGAAALSGTTLSGTAESIAGSTNDTGTFIASCAVNGGANLDLQLSSGEVREHRTVLNGTPQGHWVDRDGNKHAMGGHNLFVPASWFCPHIVLAEIIQDQKQKVVLLGNEIKNGITVLHYSINEPATDESAQGAWRARLSEIDIYLEANSLRPISLDYSMHPDDNAGVDIPVEIRFSNYTEAEGYWIPFTIEKYINSTLALKLQVSSALPANVATESK